VLSNALRVDAMRFLERRGLAEQAVDEIGLRLVGIVDRQNVSFDGAHCLGREARRHGRQHRLAADHDHFVGAKRMAGGADQMLALVATHLDYAARSAW